MLRLCNGSTRVCLRLHKHARMCTHMHGHTLIHACTHAPTCALSHVHTSVHAHPHARIHTSGQTHVHMLACTEVYKYARTYTLTPWVPMRSHHGCPCAQSQLPLAPPLLWPPHARTQAAGLSGLVQAAGVGVLAPQHHQHRHVQAQAQHARHGRPCPRMGRPAPAHAGRCVRECVPVSTLVWGLGGRTGERGHVRVWVWVGECVLACGCLLQLVMATMWAWVLCMCLFTGCVVCVRVCGLRMCASVHLCRVLCVRACCACACVHLKVGWPWQLLIGAGWASGGAGAMLSCLSSYLHPRHRKPPSHPPVVFGTDWLAASH